ncbi:MAG: DNA ligase [Gemmataceae bacterium]
MPDLNDGESVEVHGSGVKPYVLKNDGGVYSCTCPAWRNQSRPIERRTCKHLRKLRGDAAEELRLGADLPAQPQPAKADVSAPPLLLAEKWDGVIDPAGWLLSEKLDGVRAFWDGQRFYSRLGNIYHAPDWFVAGLPNVPLDGELWLGRKMFQRAVSIVRRQDKSDHWKEVRYVIFDAPKQEEAFEKRLAFVEEIIRTHQPAYAVAHEHDRCRGLEHLRTELARVEALGGEGLMLRRAGSRYECGRSLTLLKIKSFHDAEARVLKHLAGSGWHKGRLGALFVELADGTTFSVGTGFSDAQRDNPPALGSFITFRYQELTEGGVPRFPSYVGVCADSPASPSIKKGATDMKATSTTTTESSATRRFEFVEGHSSKFWEVSQQGKEVTVCYGRIGSGGQNNVKSFPDEAAALAHVEKLIREKTGKGYHEV